MTRDTIAPKLLRTEPAAGSQLSADRFQITLHFDEVMREVELNGEALVFLPVLSSITGDVTSKPRLTALSKRIVHWRAKDTAGNESSGELVFEAPD